MNRVAMDSCEEVQIPNELSTMTLGEMLKLKEELGSKIYNEVILGADIKRKTAATNSTDIPRRHQQKQQQEKRANDGPQEMYAKRQVSFLGLEKKKSMGDLKKTRDPRFDARVGEFKTNKFKEDYHFLTDIREREIVELRKEIKHTKNEEKRTQIREQMKRLINKNVEEEKWRNRQKRLKEEQQEIQRALESNQTPHYPTKKERRAKELVAQFEELKKHGGLNKHLEKRRKKNAAKDRKKISLD